MTRQHKINAAARELIEVADSLEEWALEIEGAADEARTRIAIRNAAAEALVDLEAISAAYVDGYTIPAGVRVAGSILRTLEAAL